MTKLEKEILDSMNEQFIFSLSPDAAAAIAFDFVKKWSEIAFDQANLGKSKEEFINENFYD